MTLSEGSLPIALAHLDNNATTMPNFITIKESWNLDEQLSNMLRELDASQAKGRTTEFRVRLKALMQDYVITDDTIVEWVALGILNTDSQHYLSQGD